MSQSGTTRLYQPVRLVPQRRQEAGASTGFAVTMAACHEFVRSARLRPYIAGELRRWRAGRDLIAVGAAIRTAFADAEWPDPVADAIAAGYARLGGDGTVVTVRSVGSPGRLEMFRDLRTTSDVLAACKRCFAALFTDEAIADREARGSSQLDVAVSIGIERESCAAAPAPAAPTAVDCSGYVVDDAELLRLAAWAIVLERNHTRRTS
ncbi:pyruvate phosphate dikinase-like enzyme [Kribbella orskensis]|uniref:Phosphoenolpyruvate synthase n=1 Tax=Kribbella orskensis TaxID=2512216 RepID=A0ABY2B7V6_9ACTN|nr:MULTISPECIES: PEP/pyruvate-binding domain-containing protein [Kribbella]TCN27653.1 pyruvate phosphate dikinase-like enzyme [Kribbella sp. VKM Ac-2500]TCO07575.1 pyruvate phosphate dikinase-like enzyme [Kribbella orskensis]